MAIIFLIGAILGLYWVTSPTAKLGMLSGLTVGFAGSLAMFTNARRQDVFAATAAYAAVLVVFVSGNLTTGSSGSVGSGTGGTAIITTVIRITSTVLETSTTIATQAATSSVTITTSLLSQTSTSGGVPTNVTKAGLSLGSKIGLGLGLGVGAPAFGFGVWLFARRRFG